jgi:uncharacterized protein
MMAGAILNAIGILAGAVLGLFFSRQPSSTTQIAWRGLMGVITVIVGLRATLLSFDGSLPQYLKQLIILVLALAIGKILGNFLRLQKGMNRLGQLASRKFATAQPGDPNRFSDGFLVCAIVFCASPLGTVGSLLAGLTDNWEPLAVKMAIDGLAAMGFARLFGWGVVLSALPVFVFQGLITFLAHQCLPFLDGHRLLGSVTGVAGLLIFCVSLIILELKKIEVADYLPSLAIAPVIAWLWS